MSDIPLLTPEINYGKAIMSGAFSIAVPTIQETLEKLEIMGRMHCSISGKYFMVADGPDVHCNYHHHL